MLEKESKNDLRSSSLNELERKIQNCHDEIWQGGKKDPAFAVDEFCKMLIIKVADEKAVKKGEEYQFQVKPNEKSSDVSKRIKKIFEQVQTKHPDVFTEKITLSDSSIYEVVKLIQNISFLNTDLDVKGKAIEKFLGKTFRDEYGQYFTPREIVKFCVGYLNPNEVDKIFDPACGSAGFLIYSLMHVMNKIKNNSSKKSQNKIKEFALENMFGVEVNERIGHVAMMNMVLHGDGNTNISCSNALNNYKNFENNLLVPNSFSIIMTNPPFGSKIREKEILNGFELSGEKDVQKTEILFIERCIDFLKEGGKMAIVLPDSILNNSTLQYVRDYIMNNSKILGIVSLPQQTFVPSGANVKSSLLFLQKTKIKKPYDVFMSIAKHVGYDANRLEDTNDLPQIIEDWNCFQKNDVSKMKQSSVRNIQDISNNFSPDSIVITHKANHNFTPLTELCVDVFTGRTPSKKDYTTSGYKILKVRDLTGSGIEWHNFARGYVPAELFEKTKVRIKPNDILFISSAHHPKYIGKEIDIVSYIPERFKDKITCVTELLVVRIDEKIIDPYYVLAYLKTNEGFRAIQSCIRGQTAHIYPKDVKCIQIPIPKKSVLRKLEPQIDALKKLVIKKSKIDQEIIELDENLKNMFKDLN